MTSQQHNPPLADRFVALVGLINREHELLEHLVFKLRGAEMLASVGESRFLSYITDEIDDAASDLGAIEVARALLVAELTQQLSLPEDATLLELAAHAPEATAQALHAARHRLIALVADLDDSALVAAAAVSGRLEEVGAALDRIEPEQLRAARLHRYGVDETADIQPHRFDREL